LLKLAEVGDLPHTWAMQAVARELLGVEVAKEDEVRTGWQQGGPFEEARLQYAANDAVITWEMWRKLKRIRQAPFKNALSHDIQLKGAIVLKDIETRGFGFDRKRRASLLGNLDREMQEMLATLAAEGYLRPGEKKTKVHPGNGKLLQAKLEPYKHLLGFTDGKVPKIRADAASLNDADIDDPFINTYREYKALEKFTSYIREVQGGRVHPRFTTILATGRTSCSAPNLQNPPKKPGVRECFIPTKPGHVLISCDFAALELCSLSQCAKELCGFSIMGDMINRGDDLHCAVASKIYGKTVTKADKKLRNIGKPINFGYMGGLGAAKFVKFAKHSYGVQEIPDPETGETIPLTEGIAAKFKEFWQVTFPEMRIWLEDRALDNLNLDTSPVENKQIAKALFNRIARGEFYSRAGKPYNRDVVAWALAEKKRLGYNGTSLVELSTGFRRAKTEYCEAHNTPAQGLAAAGAKLSLWFAFRDGIEITNFVHDELIVQCPVSDVDEVSTRLEDAMVTAMQSVIPDIKIDVATSVFDRWRKNAPEYPRGAAKRKIYADIKDVVRLRREYNQAFLENSDK
jgi:DNA polymerase I-like protein with 3'-5' exonuclease and polymerase domains